ncbi:hypothetical protein ACOSQ4_026029 [Xanthoceras sorbifolium]
MLEEQVFGVSWGALNAIPSRPLKLLIYCFLFLAAKLHYNPHQLIEFFFFFFILSLQNPTFWFLAILPWKSRALKKRESRTHHTCLFLLSFLPFSSIFSSLFTPISFAHFTNTARKKKKICMVRVLTSVHELLNLSLSMNL